MNPPPTIDYFALRRAAEGAIDALLAERGGDAPTPEVYCTLVERLMDGAAATSVRLRLAWIDRHLRRRSTWRDEVRKLKRTPKRLRCFAADEALAQVILYGAARANATDDLDELLRRMEDDPAFFELVISKALEEDVENKRHRLLFDAGGAPEEMSCFLPLVQAAAKVFEELTGRPLGRSTMSDTKMQDRTPGKATGPGVRFVHRLASPFKPDLTLETAAHLIRAARQTDN